MQSLHEAAASLENREAARLLSSNMMPMRLDSVLAETSIMTDSLHLLMERMKLPELKIKLPERKFKYHFRNDSLGTFQHFEFEDGQGNAWEEEFNKKLKEHQSAVEIRMEELQDRLNKKENQISVVIKKMEKESMFPGENMRSRLDTAQVANALTASLNNRGIKIPYRYAIIDNVKDSVLFSNDSNAVKNARTSNYTTQLFPNDIIPGQNFLTVWFPQRPMLLFSAPDLHLYSSFIFILIVIICFAYTLLTLIKQKKLSDMKSDFINNMTHELKTPIATIAVATDALRDTAPAANETQINYYSGIIRQENERMNAQVERVLQLARLDKREMQLNKETVNLHELVNNAVLTFSMQVEKSNGELKEELAAERPVINADPLHISNVIHNLLDNAKKYSPEKPMIKVSTWNDPKGIFLSVSDNGIGMDKETLKKVFDKFYRASRGNIHDVKGFGIGLSYVKEIMELHGGSIRVESHTGEGSTFTIFLPYE